jgi:hypothetical protein
MIAFLTAAMRRKAAAEVKPVPVAWGLAVYIPIHMPNYLAAKPLQSSPDEA